MLHESGGRLSRGNADHTCHMVIRKSAMTAASDEDRRGKQGYNCAVPVRYESRRVLIPYRFQSLALHERNTKMQKDHRGVWRANAGKGIVVRSLFFSVCVPARARQGTITLVNVNL